MITKRSFTNYATFWYKMDKTLWKTYQPRWTVYFFPALLVYKSGTLSKVHLPSWVLQSHPNSIYALQLTVMNSRHPYLHTIFDSPPILVKYLYSLSLMPRSLRGTSPFYRCVTAPKRLEIRQHIYTNYIFSNIVFPYFLVLTILL